MKKICKIEKVFEGMATDWNTHKTAFDITIPPRTEEETTFTISGDFFRRYMLVNYSEFSYFSISSTQYINDFKQLFVDFKTLNKRGIERIYNTLMDEYNPLHNYDRTEEHVTTYAGKETNTNTKSGNFTDDLVYSGSEKNETAYTGEEENTNSHGIIEDNMSVSPYEYNGFVSAEKEIESQGDDVTTTTYNDRKDTTEKTFTNREDNRTTTYNDVKDESVREFDERTDTEKITAYGNIGTTKSTEMASDEIDLRVSNAFYKIVYDWFVRDNLFLL